MHTNNPTAEHGIEKERAGSGKKRRTIGKRRYAIVHPCVREREREIHRLLGATRRDERPSGASLAGRERERERESADRDERIGENERGKYRESESGVTEWWKTSSGPVL